MNLEISMKPTLSFLLQQLTDEQIDAALLMHASTAMQSKLSAKRAEGRGGWHQGDVSPGLLMQMLERNLAEGDYVDVMNLAAMLNLRREIYGEQAPLPQVAELDTRDGILRIDSDQNILCAGEGTASAYADVGTALMWGPTLSAELTKAGADRAVSEYRLFGFDDWRLPTRKELFSLVVDGRCNPACDPAIDDMKSDGYWTDTPVPGYEGCFFVVYFDCGYVYNDPRDDLRWVRPVRSLAAPSGQ